MFRTCFSLAVAFLAAAASPAGAAGPSVAHLFGGNGLRVSPATLDARWHMASWPKLKPADGPWSALVSEAKGVAKTDRLTLVNRWVNQALRFTDDADQYGLSDHWAAAAESLALGRGDCEDYAIAKLQLLRTLGYSAGDLFVMIVRDTRLDQDHAVLVVRSEGGFAVLDNQRDEIVPPGDARDYRPIIGFGKGAAWLFARLGG